MSQTPSQEPRRNQTLLIKVQSRETEKSLSVHSSDYSEQSMLYIQLRSISEDTRDSELCPKHPHKNLDLTKHFQIRETENSRSIHSSDYPEKSMLYIQHRSISEDTRDLELCPNHPHKIFGLTKLYL